MCASRAFFTTFLFFVLGLLAACGEGDGNATYLAPVPAGVTPDLLFEKLPSGPSQRRVIAGERRVEIAAWRAFTPKDPNGWEPLTEVLFSSSVSHPEQVYSKISLYDETAGQDVRDLLYSSYWVSFEVSGFTLEFLDRPWVPRNGHVYKLFGEVATGVVNNTSISIDLIGVHFQQHGKTPGDVVMGDEIFISTPGNMALPRVQGTTVRSITNAVAGVDYSFDLEIRCPGSPNVFACALESAKGNVGGVQMGTAYIADPVSNTQNGGYYWAEPEVFGFSPSSTVVWPGEVRTVTFHIIPASDGTFWFDVNELTFRVNNISVNPETPNDSGMGCSTILWPLFNCGLG